jgi:hypothetical protein
LKPQAHWREVINFDRPRASQQPCFEAPGIEPGVLNSRRLCLKNCRIGTGAWSFGNNFHLASGIRSAKCAASYKIPAVEHLEAPWHRIPDAALMAQLFGNSQTGIEATMQRL